jgi:hypothetical protein
MPEASIVLVISQMYGDEEIVYWQDGTLPHFLGLYEWKFLTVVNKAKRKYWNPTFIWCKCNELLLVVFTWKIRCTLKRNCIPRTYA